MTPADPAGLLEAEHRLMERAIDVLADDLARARKDGGGLDMGLLGEGLGFLEEYAEVIHHPKEDSILFRGLAGKKLSDTHRELLEDLIREHAWIRVKRVELAAAIEVAGRGGNGRDDLMKILGQIVAFYPEHMRKEDRQLFGPAMAYFTDEEKASMVRECQGLNREVIQGRFREMIDSWEARTVPKGSK